MAVEFKLIDKSSMAVILPLLEELDPLIPNKVLSLRLSEMVENGYECVGIYSKHHLIGICGLWMLVKYYVGKHLELDNVYIKPKYREQGIGTALNAWLQTFARSRGCQVIELNCYINNKKGQDFWTLNGYTPIGVHYQKKVENP